MLIINRFGMLIIRMELRGKLYSILNILSQIIYFILILLLLIFFERTFRSVIYATIFSNIINAFIVFMFTRKNWIINNKYLNKRLLHDLLQFGIPLVPATMLSWVLNSFDKIGLRQWSSYEQLGLYAAAFKIVSLLSILQTIFTTTWTPIAYKWYEQGNSEENFDKVGVLILVLMSTAYLTIVIFRNVIVLFLGVAYRNTTNILIYLLFVPVMYTISETTALGIGFSKKTKYIVYISLASALINIVGNFVLIPILGARGAAITTCISYVVFFWLRTLISRKFWYKIDLFRYLINILFLALLILCVEFRLSIYMELFIVLLLCTYNFMLLKNRFGYLFPSK
jgi:O-antigen/teichoic acid export membrane protein